MNQKKKTTKSCEQCGGQNIKSRITTYPLKFDSRQFNIGSVAVKECLDCHDITPTKAGQEKIARCLGTMLHLGFFPS